MDALGRISLKNTRKDIIMVFVRLYDDLWHAVTNERAFSVGTATDLLVWLSTTKEMFVRLDFFLSRKMTWGLSGLIIISIFRDQSITMLLSDSDVWINFKIVSPQADRVLSSEKLFTEAISMKKNKSLIERLNKMGLSI